MQVDQDLLAVLSQSALITGSMCSDKTLVQGVVFKASQTTPSWREKDRKRININLMCQRRCNMLITYREESRSRY